MLPCLREPVLSAALLVISLSVSLLYVSNLELGAEDLEAGDSQFYHRAGAGVAKILANPALLGSELNPEERADLGLEDRYDSGLLRSPAYGVFLGLLYAVFGQSIHVVAVAQSALLAISALVLYLIGRRLFGSGAGFLAALLAIGYSSFLLFTGQVLTETLTLFLLVLSAYFLVASLGSPARRWPQLAGATTAALLLTKISMRFFLPLLLVLFVLLLWRAGRTIVFRRTGGFVLGLLYVLVPWMVFTTLAFGRPLITVPLGSGLTHTLYRGNYVPEDGWENDGLGDVHGPEYLEANAATAQRGWDQSAVHVAATKKAIRNDPGGFAVLVLKKTYRMWHRPAQLWPASLGVVKLPQQMLWHRVLLILGLLGMGYAIVDRKAAWLLILPILYVAAMHAVSRVEARFQVPAMPFVLLFAAGMIGVVIRHGRSWLRAIRQPATLAVLLALLLCLGAASLIDMAHLAEMMPAASSLAQHFLALLPGVAALMLFAVLLCRFYREHLSRSRACVASIAPVLVLFLPWFGQAAGDIAWREWRCRLSSPDQKVVQEIVLPRGVDLSQFSSAALQIDMLGSLGEDCDLRVTVDGQEVGRFRPGATVDDRKFIYPQVLNPLRYHRLHDGLSEVLSEVRRLHPGREIGFEYFRQWHRIPIDPELLRGKQRITIEVNLARESRPGDFIEVFGDYPSGESEEARQFVGPAFGRTLFETSVDKLRMFAADRYRADYRLWHTTQLWGGASKSSYSHGGHVDRHDLSPSNGRQYGEYRIRLELRCRGEYFLHVQPDGSTVTKWFLESQRPRGTYPVPVRMLQAMQRQKYTFLSGYLVL